MAVDSLIGFGLASDLAAYFTTIHGGGYTISQTAGPTGGPALQIHVGSATWLYRELPSYTDFIIGCRFDLDINTGNGHCYVIELDDTVDGSGGQNCGIRFNQSGTDTGTADLYLWDKVRGQIGSVYTVTSGTAVRVEIHVKLGVSGTIQWRVNGTVIATFTGNTTGIASTMRAYGPGVMEDASFTGSLFTISEVYIVNCATAGQSTYIGHGDFQVRDYLPVGDGSAPNTQWHPATGTQLYPMVNGLLAAGTDQAPTDYIDAYNLTPYYSSFLHAAEDTSRFIVAVANQVWANQASGAATDCSPIWYNPTTSTLYRSAAVAPTAAFTFVTAIQETNPLTGLAWVTSDFNVLQGGVSHISGMELVAVAQSSFTTITIVPPTVVSISPDNAVRDGGPITVAITGTGFVSGATVAGSDNAVATVGAVTYLSSTSLLVTVTPVALGTITLTVTNPGGGSATSLIFTVTYPWPTLLITVADRNRNINAEQASWNISQNWNRQGDTASFVLRDEHGDGELNFVVPALSQITLRDLYLQTDLFGGVVYLPEFAWQSPLLTDWKLSCRDYTYYSDRAIVHGDFSNMTAPDIIRSLVTQADCGITADEFIGAGPTLALVRINYKSLSAALDLVTKYASQSQLYGWYIDEDLKLHWYSDRQVAPSGIGFTDVITGAATPTLGFYAPDSSFAYQWDGGDLRNRVTVRGGNRTATQIDTWGGTGNQTAWPLTYPLQTSPLVASLTVNGLSKVVSLLQGAPTTDYVLAQSGTGQWFLAVGTDTVPGVGVPVVLTYTYIQPVVTQVNLRSSQRAYATGANRGIFHSYVTDPNILDLLTAKSRGQREIGEYGQAPERVKFTVPQNWPGHVRAGQTIHFHNSLVPDSQRNWAPGVDDDYFVVQSNITGTPGMYRTYALTAVRIFTTTT